MLSEDINMLNQKKVVCLSVICLLLSFLTAANADVFNIPSGLTNLEFVPVGNPGNAGELSGLGAGGQGANRICGAVNYSYQMGKFEITAGQYTAFLNAVAATDTYGLYNSKMSDTGFYLGCHIVRSGSAGSYTYTVASDWANRPVNLVSWDSAARFCNWLTNGQPTGGQNLSTTEDGSYYLNGKSSWTTNISRKSNALYVIPNEDEWYKAAYYDPAKAGGAGYWDYPTKSNTVPTKLLFTPDRGNNANYYYGIGSPYYTNEVGAYSNSESPYGTFDQGGNILEWNEEYWDKPSNHVFRGGSYAQDYNLLLASYRSSPFYFADMVSPQLRESDCLGFRIAYVPEPSTVSLVIVFLAMLTIRRCSSDKWK